MDTIIETTWNSVHVTTGFETTRVSINNIRFAQIYRKSKIEFSVICLLPSSVYSLSLDDHPPITIQTLPFPVTPRSLEFVVSFVSPAHRLLPFIQDDFPLDCLYTDCMDRRFWSRLLRLGLFALPSDRSGIVAIPNPRARFCIDLSVETTYSRRFTRLYLSAVDGFDFRVHPNDESRLTDSLHLCRAWHKSHSGSTWITDSFMSSILQLIGDFQFVVFELIDRSTGDVAAVSIGFGSADFFMDFTACTPLRDSRSAGKILMRRECDWLQSAGYRLWYLGFQLQCMRDLFKNPRILSRSEFAEYSGSTGE